MISDEQPGIDRRPPRLGEHSRDILQEIGFEADIIEGLVGDDVIVVD